MCVECEGVWFCVGQALLTFDVGSRESFDALDAWLQEAAKFGARDMQVVVCANKTDQKSREVKPKEAQAWAARNGYTYFETSASTGDNVQVHPPARNMMSQDRHAIRGSHELYPQVFRPSSLAWWL